MITYNKYQTASYYRNFAQIQKKFGDFLNTKKFLVYALQDIFDWKGDLVCKYAESVNLLISEIKQNYYLLQIIGSYNAFYYTKATKEEIAEIISPQKPTIVEQWQYYAK